MADVFPSAGVVNVAGVAPQRLIPNSVLGTSVHVDALFNEATTEVRGTSIHVDAIYSYRPRNPITTTATSAVSLQYSGVQQTVTRELFVYPAQNTGNYVGVSIDPLPITIRIPDSSVGSYEAKGLKPAIDTEFTLFWIPQTPQDSLWNKQYPDRTIWDDGDTIWLDDGERTFWDVAFETNPWSRKSTPESPWSRSP